MPWRLQVNRVVPFATRLAEGALHLRGYAASGHAPALLVAEFDWAVLVEDPAEAYFGAGVWTYPQHALAAARAAAQEDGLRDAGLVVVRLPAPEVPEGERYERVVDDEDPQGWEPVGLGWLRAQVPGARVDAFGRGAYTRRRIEAWLALGAPAPGAG